MAAVRHGKLTRAVHDQKGKKNQQMSSLFAFILFVMLWGGSGRKCHLQPTESSDTIQRVLDGDTVQLLVHWLPPGLDRVFLRIMGVDAPEVGKPHCDAERVGGLASRAYVQAAVDAPYRLVYCGWDKYGGRILGDVVWPADRTSLSELLLNAGHATPYDGRRAKNASRWCPQ